MELQEQILKWAKEIDLEVKKAAKLGSSFFPNEDIVVIDTKTNNCFSMDFLTKKKDEEKKNFSFLAFDDYVFAPFKRDKIKTKEELKLLFESVSTCYNCENCVDCTNCTNCTNCKTCEDCINCTDCKDCISCINHEAHKEHENRINTR